jgi:hypothetical protein
VYDILGILDLVCSTAWRLFTEGDEGYQMQSELLVYIFSVGTVVAPLISPSIRQYISQYIARSVEHKFEEQIQQLKSDLRKTEESFRSELRAKEMQLSALVQSALVSGNNRQAVLFTRRLQAVENLWAAKAQLDYFKLASALIAKLKFEEAISECRYNAEMRAFFDDLNKKLLAMNKNPQSTSIEADRPFLDPIVWSIFAAYQSILLVAMMKLAFLANGTGNTNSIKSSHAAGLLKVALPEYNDYIDKYGEAGHNELLEPLADKLLVAVTDLLEGKQSDAAALKKASELMRLAEKLRSDSEIKEELVSIAEDVMQQPAPAPSSRKI